MRGGWGERWREQSRRGWGSGVGVVDQPFVVSECEAVSTVRSAGSQRITKSHLGNGISGKTSGSPGTTVAIDRASSMAMLKPGDPPGNAG